MPLQQIVESVAAEVRWRLEAPPDRVWSCLTSPSELPRWLGTPVEGAVAAGSDVVVDHGEGMLCRSTVTAYDAPRVLALTWEFPDEPPSRLRLELNGRDGGTDLRLRHDDLGDLADDYRDGWCVHLTYLEAAALDSPLPKEMFWPLHATVARLRGAAPA